MSPHVLMIGGFLSSPPAYRPLRERLLTRGAASVSIAPIWLPDWMLVWQRGQGPIATRAARALLAASHRADGAPLLVIGHSAGGILARILTAEAPFEGRRFAGAGRIGAIVTLGTPHVNAWETWTSRRSGVYRHDPGRELRRAHARRRRPARACARRARDARSHASDRPRPARARRARDDRSRDAHARRALNARA